MPPRPSCGPRPFGRSLITVLLAVATGCSGVRAGRSDADAAMGREIREEIERERHRQLEREIEDELQRQEELLRQIDTEQRRLAQPDPSPLPPEVPTQPTDPSAPPRPPVHRQIPDSLFDRQARRDGKREQIAKVLDADGDGRSEIEILYHAKTGALVARWDDTNYDGLLDTLETYGPDGRVASLQEDTNHDGVPDRWTTFSQDVAVRVEVDRDFDGVRDGFYVYEAGWRKYEEHDTNNDGRIDRRVEYTDRRRSLETEDRNFDGEFDIWTYYDAEGIPIRAEIDSNGDGKPDVWEHYEGTDPMRIALARKEEDVNGDGKVDVISHYSGGKLVRQEISDPALIY